MKPSLNVVALSVAAAVIALAAQPIMVKPFVYDPGATGIITAAWVPHTGLPRSPGDVANHGLILQKDGATSVNAAAEAQVTGVAKMSTTSLALGFDYLTAGHCGTGSP